MKTNLAATLASLTFITACATPVSPERVASADYGPPPPANYEEIIKERFSRILIDPTSPLYEIEKPHRGYTLKSPSYGTSERFGWVVCGTVNSKNRMGGYSGRLPFFTLFQGGQLVTFIPGESDSRSVINSDIERSCSRRVP